MRQNRLLPFAIVFSLFATIALPLADASAQVVEAPEPPSAERPGHHPAPAYGHLGASVRPLNADLRRHFGAPSESGVLVASVAEGGAAEVAGLAVGDVIVGVDGRRIGSVAALHRELRRRAGERVELEVYRDGEPLRLAARLGSRPVRHHHHHDWDSHDWEEHWEEWGEGWAEWGEQWGEGWAEWGEEFGERWAELGAEMGERWGERGAEWGEIGAEIGLRMAEAFAEMDWEEMDRALEESMRALDEIDWEEIGEEIERALEEVGEALEESLEELDGEDGGRRLRRPA